VRKRHKRANRGEVWESATREQIELIKERCGKAKREQIELIKERCGKALQESI